MGRRESQGVFIRVWAQAYSLYDFDQILVIVVRAVQEPSLLTTPIPKSRSYRSADCHNHHNLKANDANSRRAEGLRRISPPHLNLNLELELELKLEPPRNFTGLAILVHFLNEPTHTRASLFSPHLISTAKNRGAGKAREMGAGGTSSFFY